MTLVNQVAWIRSQGLNVRPATAVHLVAEGQTRTLCGVAVPADAPPNTPWYQVKVQVLDGADYEEFDDEERRDCKRCQARQAKGTPS
ncbi:MAG: hypothetical protein NVS3B1_17660 [Marmoricola sp.]